MYPVVFIDPVIVKIRDGQVANRPIYVAIGVTVDGERQDRSSEWTSRLPTMAQPFLSKSLNGVLRVSPGSLGNPRPRSPTMLRCT